MSREKFLSDESITALRHLLGKTIHTIYAPNLDAAGAHLAAWTLSMLLDKDSFINFSCEWSETPQFLNDSWQITVAKSNFPLKIATNETGALLEPCTISMYHAKPIREIEIFAFENYADNEGPEETVNYEQVLIFNCEEGKSFCIGCALNGPGIAEFMRFSEDLTVIGTIIAGSKVRLTLNQVMHMQHPIAVSVASAALTSAVAGGLASAALWPQSQLFGKVLIAGRNPNEIALTYDDGPNDVATERLLELLAHHNVRATFFLIGRFVRQRPQLARAIASAGHLIGNHTVTHPWLAWQSASRIREELTGCNAILEDTLGIPIRYFRPPHGSRRPYVVRTARELGLTTVHWNITAFDWNPLTPEAILANITRGIARNQQRNRGSNVLMHDGGDQSLGQPRMPTVEATSRLLDLYKQNPETKFVTVDFWG